MGLLENFAVAAEDIGWGFLVIGRGGVVELINAVAAGFLDVDPHHALGRKWEEIIADDVGSNSSEIKPGQAGCCDVVVKGRKIRVRQIPIWEENLGAVDVQIWEDWKWFHRMARDLREAVEQVQLLKSIIEAAFEDIAAVDTEGRILFMGEKTAKGLGVDPRSVVGKAMRDIRSDCLMEEVARTGVPQMGKLWRVNGIYRPVVVVPLIKEGRLAGSVCRSVFSSTEEAENFVKALRRYYGTVLKGNEDKSLRGHEHVGARYTFDHIIGQSTSMRRVKDLALQAAKSDAPVLLVGETGTGKELFAHAIHNASMRSEGPFVEVNCASIPETLLESELFGYEEGAFTGARKGGMPGKFELADGGTLFLDEVGDMSPCVQAKLLRALQGGDIQKIGARRAVRADVRVIAATNKNLLDMVYRGCFREDLYYRLDVFRVHIPPLRHRMEDLECLVGHFTSCFSVKYGKEVTGVAPEVMSLFYGYSWPGNVRELENVIEGAVCLCGDRGVIDLSCLPANFLERASSFKRSAPAPGGWGLASGGESAMGERERIKRALELAAGNKRRAAALLGVARSTLYEKLKLYGLK